MDWNKEQIVCFGTFLEKLEVKTDDGTNLAIATLLTPQKSHPGKKKILNKGLLNSAFERGSKKNLNHSETVFWRASNKQEELEQQ